VIVIVKLMKVKRSLDITIDSTVNSGGFMQGFKIGLGGVRYKALRKPPKLDEFLQGTLYTSSGSAFDYDFSYQLTYCILYICY
jgi:hypothetical protein